MLEGGSKLFANSAVVSFRFILIFLIRLPTVIIKQKINLNKFQKSIQKIINDNEAYRIALMKDKEHYYFKEFQDRKFLLEVIEINGKSRRDKLEQAKLKAEKEINNGFNLFKENASRFLLYKLDENYYFFVISLSHLITDGISLGITLYNIFNYYENETVFLQKSTKDYLQYIDDEREYFKTETGLKEINYWTNELFDFKKIDTRYLPALGEKIFLPENSGKTFIYAKKSLNRIAREYNVRLFNIVLLAYHITIFRLYHWSDSMIMFFDSNRIDYETRSTIGFLAQVVPNRMSLNLNDSISSILQKLTKKVVKNVKNRKTASHYFFSPFMLSFISQDIVKNTPELLEKDTFEFYDFPLHRNIDRIFLLISDFQDVMHCDLSGSSEIFGTDFIREFETTFKDTLDLIQKDINIKLKDISSRDSIFFI